MFSLEVKKRVRSWVSGFVNEMRKKSPATIQKWVDSIAVDGGEKPSATTTIQPIEEETFNCDSNELKIDEPSTSDTNENLKVRLNEICSKLSLKNKKTEIKNLIAKTSQKLQRGSSQDQPMEQDDDDSNDTIKDDATPVHDEITPITGSSLRVQRCHIGKIGRSSSENPSPGPSSRNRRLNDIGRSFSVANENELPAAPDSSENLIYDADEDISIAIPSFNTSPSIISINTNQSISNSQLTPSKINLLSMKPLREHTMSEGRQSPHVQHKNPLLRDSSFQVRVKTQSLTCFATTKNRFSSQSDSSHCSSVESLLEARKPDAEAILINLGFGPARGSDDVVSKIPKR